MNPQSFPAPRPGGLPRGRVSDEPPPKKRRNEPRAESPEILVEIESAEPPNKDRKSS